MRKNIGKWALSGAKMIEILSWILNLVLILSKNQWGPTTIITKKRGGRPYKFGYSSYAKLT